ncbi:MAG: hypothetical protein J6O88_10280 [Chryseobacterium sp.]|uniref:hypothetical protein n=1 Tax=Chryseobacterium sp. TaxID=1871047 RepID=UPI001B16031B|nr:hypothetical protein [Chryseobacterium sp.]MBO6185053.1 hypothetical protein [Chryseobacterium sp.]
MELGKIQNKQLGNAMIFEIELKNGKKSMMTTIYNNSDLDFEELVSHTQIALKKSNKVKSVKTTVGSLRSGQFEGIFFYDHLEFTNSTTTF